MAEADAVEIKPRSGWFVEVVIAGTVIIKSDAFYDVYFADYGSSYRFAFFNFFKAGDKLKRTVLGHMFLRPSNTEAKLVPGLPTMNSAPSFAYRLGTRGSENLAQQGPVTGGGSTIEPPSYRLVTDVHKASEVRTFDPSSGNETANLTTDLT